MMKECGFINFQEVIVCYLVLGQHNITVKDLVEYILLQFSLMLYCLYIHCIRNVLHIQKLS